MSAGLQGSTAHYVAVGHVTVDVLEDGERRPGGTVLYSALQAARLGLQATIVTRGEPSELRALLEPFAEEVELLIEPAVATTTLGTEGSGSTRRQHMLAWAGPVDLDALPSTGILHLAPVAAELHGTVRGDWEFVGITPQGMTRRWEDMGGLIGSSECDPALLTLAGRCDALVLSELERRNCTSLLERALAGGATAAVTAGPGTTEILLPNGGSLDVAVDPVERPADDLGAGDVYAAAFFTRLATGAGAREAARTASAAAALRMSGIGPAAIAGAETIERYAARAGLS